MARALMPVLLLTLASPTVRVQDAPARVLTDTLDYCHDLARRAEAWPDVPENVQSLLDQGRRLCERGQVAAGIARLRRAMVAMDHPETH